MRASKPAEVRWVQGRGRVQLLDGDAVLSEVRTRPGPTHAVFDLLAAAAAALAPGPRVAVLGFAAGGLVAPLRAMGCSAPIEAVDLSLTGARRFDRVARSWAGSVNVTRCDAARWLSRSRRRFDLIVEDLSVTRDGHVSKPTVSLEDLPALMRRRLTRSGVVVTNLLPIAGWSWRRVFETLAGSYDRALVVSFLRFENRVVIAGDELDGARQVSQRLRSALRRCRSRLAGEIRLSSL